MTSTEIASPIAAALQQADPASLQSLLRLHRALIIGTSTPGPLPPAMREGFTSQIDAIEEALLGRLDAADAALWNLRRTVAASGNGRTAPPPSWLAT
ncbi:MAG: hypothetical protein VX672_04065 [Planctomycetota bacterium]|nr:hypothetical protein [Planctomycetota bacterium]